MAVAAGTSVVVVLLWWIIYARLTPFPAMWTHFPREIDGEVRWEALAFGVIAVALIGATLLVPHRRSIGIVGVATWFVLSVREIRRGDGDGLWALMIPVYVVAGVALLVLIELIRFARRRRKTESSHGWPRVEGH